VTAHDGLSDPFENRYREVQSLRVAVSATHCCGKSTLIDAFLLVHPDFTHEPEPYTVMEEDYGEVFAAEPSAEDFYRQLEFNVERLRLYQLGARVIFERCPADFLAYLLALHDLQRGGVSTRLIERSLDMARNAIQLLDLIVFLPLNEEEDVFLPDSEDPELRSAVNRQLESIFTDDQFELFSSNRPVILEAVGSTRQRLQILENTLKV
jgi:hypothetical protein